MDGREEWSVVIIAALEKDIQGGNLCIFILQFLSHFPSHFDHAEVFQSPATAPFRILPSQNVFPQSSTDDISHLPPIHFNQPMLLRTYHCPHSALYKPCIGWPALFLDSWPLKMGPIGHPRMTTRNYLHSLHGSLGKRNFYFSCVIGVECMSYSNTPL